jgi:formylglycine-generating enzyme required for sulfatase activity
VDGVSFWDAAAFCNALSVRAALPECYTLQECSGAPGAGLQCSGIHPAGAAVLECAGYRLPTEAEWELAARAGTTAARYGPLDDIAWWGAPAGGTQPAATRAPNAWGLFDMLGNVFEWTWDVEHVYEPQTAFDPAGPDEGERRMARGGSWFSADPAEVRASVREALSPGFKSAYNGFRCARGAP